MPGWRANGRGATTVSDTGSRTFRQSRGADSEAAVAAHLAGQGWQMVARNVRLDGVEVDLVAVDPGPPPSIVVVEVRSGRSPRFGVPEETVDRAKVTRLYRALAAVTHELLPRAMRKAGGPERLGRRVDLVVVDERSGRREIRHLRGLEPPR